MTVLRTRMLYINHYCLNVEFGFTAHFPAAPSCIFSCRFISMLSCTIRNFSDRSTCIQFDCLLSAAILGLPTILLQGIDISQMKDFIDKTTFGWDNNKSFC